VTDWVYFLVLPVAGLVLRGAFAVVGWWLAPQALTPTVPPKEDVPVRPPLGDYHARRRA
jgi:hypothetical protein